MDETTIPEVAWVEYITDANKQYFCNKETKETTWKIPPDYTAWKEKAVKEYLKTTNWRKAVDKNKTYYYDKVTKQTQWNVPSDVVDFETWLLKLNLYRYDSRKRKAKEISTEVKEDVAPVVSVITAEIKEDIAPVVSTVSLSQEDIRPSSKIKKRAVEKDYDDDDDDYPNEFDSGGAGLSTATSIQKSSRGDLNDASNNSYHDGDQRNDYDGKEQQRQNETKTDAKSNMTSQNDGADQNNDYEDDYFNQHERGLTPEQVTPQYDEATPEYDVNTPPFDDGTPELGTHEFQEATPEYGSPVIENREVGTPVFQETTPDYVDNQDATPNGSEGDNYENYGEYDRHDSTHVGESHPGDSTHVVL